MRSRDSITNVAPMETDAAIKVVCDTVIGETMWRSVTEVADDAYESVYGRVEPRLRRLFLVAHGRAGFLYLNGDDSAVRPVCLEVNTYRGLLPLTSCQLLDNGGEVWLVGCNVACEGGVTGPQYDGPLLLLSMARYLNCTVAAPRDYVDVAWFGPDGPDEKILEKLLVRVAPGDCPPQVPLPDTATLPPERRLEGPPLDILLNMVEPLTPDLLAATMRWRAPELLRAVNGKEPYDGTGALDHPALAMGVLVDGHPGTIEITLDGLALALRFRDQRIFYLKAPERPNLMTFFAHEHAGEPGP